MREVVTGAEFSNTSSITDVDLPRFQFDKKCTISYTWNEQL